jgi:hypothetical protein
VACFNEGWFKLNPFVKIIAIQPYKNTHPWKDMDTIHLHTKGVPMENAHTNTIHQAITQIEKKPPTAQQ